ncbi:MAG: hypothetical protein ACK55Z_23930 [bacterium]
MTVVQRPPSPATAAATCTFLSRPAFAAAAWVTKVTVAPQS